MMVQTNKVPGSKPDTLDTVWFTPGRFAVLLGGLILAAYPGVFLGWESFGFRDFGLYGYPVAHYHRQCFWRGELPLWNPLNNCGIPFLAQWSTLVLYPLSLFYLLFSQGLVRESKEPLSSALCDYPATGTFFAEEGQKLLEIIEGRMAAENQ